MLTLAFYKGTGRWEDRVIRWVTRSSFSHVEMLAHPPAWRGGAAWLGQSWSSSGREGGVRGKEIVFERDRWEFLAGWPLSPRGGDEPRLSARIGACGGTARGMTHGPV